ncbi:outer membrane secretion protein W [Beggiatoa sp. SS]|nr:outer membrane secretion protein W [Beggiatoa sp. SS]
MAHPAQQQRSSLQRVAYHLEDKTLWRSYWRVLDRAQDAQPIRMGLLNEVNEIQLRYLDEHLRWHEQWPPLNFSNGAPNEQANSNQTLKAIEVTLTVAKWGRLTRLFRIP